MAQGLARFRGRLLLLVSGNDLTAMEFLQYTTTSRDWDGQALTGRELHAIADGP